MGKAQANSEARNRLLKAAEALFVQRGYEAVTVKDIAKATGIHHASIYHHIPGGKSALFLEVMTRHLQQHQSGIETALTHAEKDVRSQLIAIAHWLLSQPPLDMIRLSQSDLPAIDSSAAQQLDNLAFETLMLPIANVLVEAQIRGEVKHEDLGNVAGAILSAVEGLHAIPDIYLEQNSNSREHMATQLIDVFLRGIAPE
ncbi:MAG: TetR/AcrR family transcriptional regulator [Cyanobacteria bacterium J06554_1]